MQIVYISRRPRILIDTISQARRFMPYIDEVVVACPEAVAPEVTAIQKDKVTVVTDEELLGGLNASLTDHQKRNLSLRSRLVRSPVIRDMFVMSDDDSRPLREIPIEIFIENGCYHNYYFYDLPQWSSNGTDFDRGQHNTCAVLTSGGYPHLSYASHMPQIIDRAIFLEAVDSFSAVMKKTPLCEWSLYFNFAQRFYPNRFHSPRPYLTFCWPDAPFTWPSYTQPGGHYFENFYSRYYDPGGIFYGISAAPGASDAEQVFTDKLLRWQQVADARANGYPLLNDPWVGGSRARLLFLKLLRPWVRLFSHLGMQIPFRGARFLVGCNPAELNE